MIDHVSTTAAPTPAFAYSQAILARDFIFTSGQVGLNPESLTRPDDFREEVRQALANLRAVLSAGGAELSDVVRTMCLLTDVEDFDVFNEEYAAFFGDQLPARSTFGVALAKGFRFEIEAIAYVAKD